MKIRLSILLSLLVVMLGLSSCATTGGPEPYSEKLSTQPHNSPQGWEGQAAIGSFFPGSR